MSGTIIYYGGFYLPDKNAAANRVVSNGKLFDKLGYKTIFLGADYTRKSQDINKLSDNMFEAPHPESSVQWLKSILFFENLRKLSAEYDDVKLVILYNVPFITLVLAKVFFKRIGISVAYDCTEWTRYTDGSLLKRVFKIADEFFIRRFAHLVADKMIVISKMMERAYASNKQLLRLPPLVDISEPIWNQHIEKNPERFTFCFAGFLDGNKDCLDIVIQSFLELNRDDTVLNIVGLTESELCEKYPHMQSVMKSASNISFLGKCTHSGAVYNILNCDCYIFIRKGDRRNNAGFPTKFAESYTCGVPVITTNISDISDYADNESVMILESVDVESISSAMEKVISQKPIDSKLKTDFDYNKYTELANEWLTD